MKSIKYLLALFMISVFQSACILDNAIDCEHGRGDAVVETFDLDRISEISLRMDADVFLIPGDFGEITVSGQANIIDEIDFKIRDDKLIIDNHRCLRNYSKVEITITLPEFRALSVSGSGEIRTLDRFVVDDVELHLSGSGLLMVDMEADDVECQISGSGEVELLGFGDDLDVRLSGSGELKAFDFPVRRSSIFISGSGDVEVDVSDFLDVRISGSGDIYYRGNPEIDSKISGSGRVIDDN